MTCQRLALSCFLVLACAPLASATIMTSFTEDSLPVGLNLDIPNPGLASITLDTANDELDIDTTGNTDMWTARNNAPFAWTASPTVNMGETWYVETEVRLNGTANAGQRVAGIVFYANADGVGGSNGGVDFSYGINDWNDRGVELQGLGGTQVGDSGLGNITSVGDIGDVSTAFLRMEIMENGASDQYTAFYKVNAGDEWTQLAQFNSSQDNARTALFLKTGNSITADGQSVSFTYLEVGPTQVIPEPSSLILAGLGLTALAGAVLRRRRRTTRAC